MTQAAVDAMTTEPNEITTALRHSTTALSSVG